MVNFLSNTLAVWRPALQQPSETPGDRFKPNEGSILIRTGIVFAACLATMARIANSPYGMYAPLLLPVCVFMPLVFFNIESTRATRAANDLAVKLFMNNKQVPADVMNHLQKHPEAVKTLVAQPGFDLNKTCEVDGKTLVERSFERTSYHLSSYNGEEKNLIQILKLLIANGAPVQAIRNLFIHSQALLSYSDKIYSIDLLIFALQTEKIKASDFTKEEIHRFWKNVKDEQLAKLMIDKGFDISSTNKDCETPILSLIKEKLENSWISNENKILFLMKHGATLPADETMLEIKTKGEDDKEVITKKTIKNFVDENPAFKTFLDNAKKVTKEAEPLQFESRVFSLKPALNIGGKYKNFEVSTDTIFFRAMFVAVPILYTLGMVLAGESKPLMLAATFLTFAGGALVATFERLRATKALNKIAVEQFKTASISSKLLEYVAKDEAMVDQLIADKANLLKIDDENHTLLDIIYEQGNSLSSGKWSTIKFEIKFSIFKKLTANLLDTSASVEKKKEYFFTAVKSGHSEYVEYLFKNKIVSVSDFSEGEQFTCFINVNDAKTVRVLKENGFNPNAKNDKEYTPLLQVLTRTHYYLGFDFNQYLHVKALLEDGADPKATVDVKEKDKDVTVTKTKTALDLVHGSYKDSITRLLKDTLAKDLD